MAVTINASTSAGLVQTADTSGVLQLQTNSGTTALTIDTSQNVGIGTTSPSIGIGFNTLKVKGVGAGGVGTAITESTDGASWLQLYSGASTSDDPTFIYPTGKVLRFGTGTQNTSSYTERMRIDSSGNVLVGTTTVSDSSKLTIQSSVALALRGTASTNCGTLVFVRADNNVTSFKIAVDANDFYIANAAFSKYALLAGQSFTGWTFGSDKRLKTNIQDLSYGLDEVLKIKPRQFNYIENNKYDIGFIAQELQTVIPEVVSGTEIPYDDNDTPQEKASKTMGVSKDALIPVLVKAIQEQQTIINDLKARIETLEAK